MPRVRWYCPLPILCLILSFWICSVNADCWYDDDKYEEGREVATTEPCLNCTCSRGTLLCYLRVCPKLPNPPPPGCILLHRYRTCCPQLICTELFGGGNSLEARSEPDSLSDIPYDKKISKNACIANGSIYGPGSAMDSSSLCEYCYCLGGKQTCVKPKCLLPIDGCVPMYEPTNCCPVHYNCTSIARITSSTTTTKPKHNNSNGGCLVDGLYYEEGGKVLGVGHSVCDNCYCLRGILRCEPLSCAPPLLGCSPVIKSGECCAASYNCSGTIEIEPEPNYGHYPIVSKEYAKLRRQQQQQQTTKNNGIEKSDLPFYVIAESTHTTTKMQQQRSPGTFGTTRHFTGISFNPSTTKPFYYNSMMEESLATNTHSTRSYQLANKFPGLSYATTNYEFQNTNYKRPHVTTTTNKPNVTTEQVTFRTINSITTTTHNKEKTKEKLRSADYLGINDDTILSLVDSLLDNRLTRKVENETTTSVTAGTESWGETTTTEVTSTNSMDDKITDTTIYDTTTYETTETVTSNSSLPVTVKTILNSTDCIDGNDIFQERQDSNIIEVTTILPVDANEINKLADTNNRNEVLFSTSSAEYTDITTENDITEVDLESKVKVSSSSRPKRPLEIEAILNISKSKEEDYEYDYNEPSLPPSLPNLRIIPFVAADALDSKKETIKDNTVYPQERVTDTSSFGYTNLFSPPIETEGGFIPKDPPILENFYENAVTVPSIANTIKPTEVNCVSEGQEIIHGQSVASDSACITCTCFYGNIVCQKSPCPIPEPGCRKSSIQDLSSCCPQYVCDDKESPTVVLDRLESTANSQEVVTVAEGVVTPDPFRDVIRTEPAPDLQSLIVDMMPFLARKTTPIPSTTPPTTTPITTTTKVNETDNNDSFSFDKVLQLLFSDQTDEKTETTTQQIQTETTKTKSADYPTTSVAPSVDQLIQTTSRRRENSNEKLTNNNLGDSTAGVGLLKLAGCNIYGRMYRVGRIISELSNPCLECKCTEIGVQCRALKC